METVSIRNTSSYKVRKLSLKQASTNQTRIIHHLHFTEWPDHGVPHDPKHFLGKFFFVNLLCYLQRIKRKKTWLSSLLGIKIKPDRYAEVAVQITVPCLDCCWLLVVTSWLNEQGCLYKMLQAEMFVLIQQPKQELTCGSSDRLFMFQVSFR